MKLGMIRNGCTDADFEYVKGKGLDFVEVCLNYANEARAWVARKDEIKALVKKHGLPILSCGRWNGDEWPLDESGKINAAALRRVRGPGLARLPLRLQPRRTDVALPQLRGRHRLVLLAD